MTFRGEEVFCVRFFCWGIVCRRGKAVLPLL
jgi:hypothetical protein